MIRQTLSKKEKGTRVVQIIDIISTVQYEHTSTGTVVIFERDLIDNLGIR